ncbi:uncharacterized protein TM35_000013010 [Trypanosoma theileri]|uniref:Uncharacterized protein n=1 Tax=Trypanosoma theileri TaxID=67003 RepID=A0A1X0P914_9TRYP|nr:uncharacterized protein TM35_000013010 [Trypanosoma theileri]ORC93424.1 hypothetical protein TM35_000013010 [Trypanosoma theileri]
MCRAGRAGWFFTDAEGCFIGRDLHLQQCVCPIATCVSTAGGHACHFTSSFLVFCGFLLIIWLIAVGAYAYMSGIIREHKASLRPEKSHSMNGGYYFEKLFGNEKPETATLVEMHKS